MFIDLEQEQLTGIIDTLYDSIEDIMDRCGVQSECDEDDPENIQELREWIAILEGAR